MRSNSSLKNPGKEQTQRQPRLSLHQKGNLLVAVPVVLQLILLIALWLLSNNADQSAVQAGIQKERARAARTFILQSQFVCTAVATAILKNQPVEPRARTFAELCRGSQAKLMTYFADDKPTLRLIENIQLSTVSLLQDANYTYLVRQLNSRHQSEGQNNLSRIRQKQEQLLNQQQELQTIIKNHPTTENTEQQNKRKFWFSLAIAGTFVNFLSMAVVALIFNLAIVKRLYILSTNVSRFTRGQRLQEPMAGDDEIATLDQNFYQMSTQMHTIEQTQKTLFETVDCLLCQVDNLGRFEQANSAAKSMLGLSPATLKGKYIEDLVPPDERKSAIDFLTRAIQQGTQAPFELTIAKPDGTLIYTLWTARYVAEQKRVFCVVQNATERIEAERVRKQVLQMVSHDLRSPLSSIGLIYKLMDAGHIVALDNTGKAALKKATASINKMLTMVNNLLDIEKMEAGMLQLEIETVNVGDATALAISSVSDLIESKQVVIDARQAKDRVIADKFRLVQILSNLLSNAIKASPSGSQVTVSTQPGNGYLKVTVTDQGSGIPLAQQKHIFDPYRQQSSDLITSEIHKGMGLAICRALVHLHGGEIALESQPGKGSSFYFSLPDQSYNPDNKF